MMRHPRGLTLAELLLIVAIVAALIAMLAYALTWGRESSRRTACRWNLVQLVKGMDTYLNHDYPCPLGRGSNPDDYNGAEWLAALYWAGVIPDPGIFLCPASGDWNRDGLDIGSHVAAPAFGSQTVSYAGMHYRSLTRADGTPLPCGLRWDVPPNTPLASDDTQGSINHGATRRGGLNVVYFSGRAEWKTREQVDVERGVGDRSGGPHNYAKASILWHLRN